MKVLIVAATAKEVTLFHEHFNISANDFVQHQKFDLLITGVGMTATAFALGKHLNSDYDLVLNVGIAGSFNQNIPLGSLVNIVSDTFAELGAEDNDAFITINDLGFGKSMYHASFDYNELPKVSSITVNKVHGNKLSISELQNRLTVQTESMEGAAVFYACEQLNIPCLQVRAISNYVEPRNKETWQIGLAIKNLNNWLIDFITNNGL
ncbi:MAG: futalosine hydrolase [Flavobacterium sp.]|nr:MAG: futalosine hydrolase [Flavobacterium sp.]